MPIVHVGDIEAAINWWRARSPTQGESALAPETNALADVYGRMIVERAPWLEERALSLEALAAFETWAETQPDSPCIAICSTSVGDAICAGCGRSFDEVTRWTGMDPIEKRAVWRRITTEGHWLRFTPKYADRQAERRIATVAD
jgi:predicted Fe-S protein YdhL (DUF1289 family)